jgi:transcription antitermination factor NusG
MLAIIDLPYNVLHVSNNDLALRALERRKLHPFSPRYFDDSNPVKPRLAHLCRGYVFIPAVHIVARDLQGLDAVRGFATKGSGKSYKAQSGDNRLSLCQRTIATLAKSSMDAALLHAAALNTPTIEKEAPPLSEAVLPVAQPNLNTQNASVTTPAPFAVGDAVTIRQGFFFGQTATVYAVGRRGATLHVAGISIEVPFAMLERV